MKKMAAWFGMALFAATMAIGCGSKAKPAETTPAPATEPAAGGATYGAPEGGSTYGAPAPTEAPAQ